MGLLTSGAPEVLVLIEGGMENGGGARDVGGAVGQNYTPSLVIELSGDKTKQQNFNKEI